MRRWLILVLVLAGALALWWVSQPVRLPTSRGDWAAQGTTPEEAVAAFVRPLIEGDAGIRRLRSDEQSARFRVEQSIRGDDSAQGVTYFVTVRREGARWVIDSATYWRTCKRGWSFRGSPCP